MGKSYVYCFQLGEYVKIGMSADPEKRLRQLQTSLPHDLVPLYIYETKNAKEEEKRLHEKLTHLKKNREWFRYTDEVDHEFRLLGAKWVCPTDNSYPQFDINIDNLYSGKTVHDIMIMELAHVAEYIGDLCDQETQWVIKMAKKNHAGFGKKKMLYNQYIETILNVRENCSFYEKSNKVTHLDYRYNANHINYDHIDYIEDDYNYYHFSEKYLYGIIYNKYNGAKLTAWQSLIKFTKDQGYPVQKAIADAIEGLVSGNMQTAINAYYNESNCYSKSMIPDNLIPN